VELKAPHVRGVFPSPRVSGERVASAVLWRTKAELTRADVSYRELAERLKKHGLKETEASVANKISRGTFPATFFLAALTAIGCASVTLEDI
jgi:uncharacterized protein DUF6471